MLKLYYLDSKNMFQSSIPIYTKITPSDKLTGDFPAVSWQKNYQPVEAVHIDG